MKKNLFLSLNVVAGLCLFPHLISAQSSQYNLGTVSNFTIFSSAGAVSDGGKSSINGIVGSNAGAITGFKTTLIATAPAEVKAAADLAALVGGLNTYAASKTISALPLVLSGSITPGVYSVTGAASIATTLTLTGKDLATDIFIIQVSGAFSTAAGASIILDHVNPDNVFFQVQGAIAFGAGSTFAGNFIGSAAIAGGANCIFNGRLLTTAGAIAVSGVQATNPDVAVVTYTLTAPVLGTNLKGLTVYSAAGAVSDAGKSTFTGKVGTNAGAVTGFKATVLADATTDANAAAELTSLVNTLNAIQVTAKDIPLVLDGSMAPGFYSVTGAASIATSLTLTGSTSGPQVFVIQVSGAFSTAAGAKIILNGVNPDSVFFQVQGAIAFGAGSTLAGNFIGSAAIAGGANCIFNGRLLTTAGAIALSGVQATNPDVAALVYTLTAPVLGTNLKGLTVYSAAGAVSDAGKSTFTGKVGTNAGAVTGFKAIVIADAATDANAAAELTSVVNTLNAIQVTAKDIPLVLDGSLAPGFYSVTGAASIATSLTLTGSTTGPQVFVIQVSGAFSTAAGAKIILNGVNPDSVFFQVQGAIAFGAGSTLAGNFIGSAAIAGGANCIFNGRLLTTAGAIALSGVQATNPDVAAPPPYVLTAPSLGTNLIGLTVYSAAGAVSDAGKSTFTGKVGTNAGAVTGFKATVLADATTDANAAAELTSLVNTLNAIPATPTDIPLVLDGTLAPGFYSVTGAASIATSLTLTGTATDIYIIQVSGAFTTAAGAKIILGKVNPDNVFFQVQGAIAFGAGSTLAGNFIGSAAIAGGANCIFNGRLLTTAGAIALSGVQATNPDVAAPPAYVLKAPVLGTNISGFTIYTAAGAVANTGISPITGNVGSQAGAITGFTSTSSIHIADQLTISAATELLATVDALNNIPVTATTLGAIIGNGQTLTSGVYNIPSAGSLSGDLYFDGGADSVFIIQITGAFTTAAGAKVHLLNGVQSKNIFWQVQGAVAMAAGTAMYGNVIGSAAIAMAAGCTLEGRLLTTAGAIAISGLQATTPPTSLKNLKTASSLMTSALTVSSNIADVLSIYPNPVYDKINLSFTGNKSEIVSTEIYDANQTKVYTAKGYNPTFNLSLLKAGVYIVMVRTNSKTISKQFILLKK